MGCSLKRQNVITITNAFQKTLDEHNPEPNKIWVDKGSKISQGINEIMVTRQ